MLSDFATLLRHNTTKRLPTPDIECSGGISVRKRPLGKRKNMWKDNIKMDNK